MIDIEKEKLFLKNVYSSHVKKNSLQTKIIRGLTFKTISKYLNTNDSLLELGCSDGYMTEQYAKCVKEVDVVDGSEYFINLAKNLENNHIKNVTLHLSLFETFRIEKEYDIIIASFILEHVLDPIEVLKTVYNLLKEDGTLIIVVPNANALSRQLALEMGLYSNLKELTEHDKRVGHRRVYDIEDLKATILKSGFYSVKDGGIMVKILADFQLDELYQHKILGESQVEGLYKLGEKYPELCGGIYSICKKKI